MNAQAEQMKVYVKNLTQIIHGSGAVEVTGVSDTGGRLMVEQ
jgi:hypothetical protein